MVYRPDDDKLGYSPDAPADPTDVSLAALIQGILPPAQNQPLIPGGGNESPAPVTGLPSQDSWMTEELGMPAQQSAVPPARGVPAQPPPAPASQGGVRDILQAALQGGPHHTPYPSEPAPSVLGALKEFGLGMIPGYRRMKDTYEKRQFQNVQTENQAALDQYNKMMEIVKPTMTREFDFEQELQEYDRRKQYLLSQGIPNQQATLLSMDPKRSMPVGTPAQYYDVEFADSTPQNPSRISAQRVVGADGVTRMLTMDGTEISPTDLAQAKIYKQAPRPLKDPAEAAFDKQSALEVAMWRQKHPPADPNAPPTEAEKAQAKFDWQKSIQPAPAQTLIQAPGPTGENQQYFANPRNPNAPATPIQLPGGAPALTKQAEPPMQLKTQASSAYNSLNLLKRLNTLLAQNPDLVGPASGRLNDYLLGVGKIPNAPPGKETAAAELDSTMNYLFGTELRAMFPNRPPREISMMIHETSAQMKQDPNIITGFLNTVDYMARGVLKNPALSGWNPINEMRGPDYEHMSFKDLEALITKGDAEAAKAYLKKAGK